MERLRLNWWIAVPGWLWALLPLWASSGGAVDVYELLGLVMTGGIVGLYWLCCTVYVLKAERFRALALWLSVPVVWVASVVLAASDVPFVARFYLSEPAFRRYAERNDDPDPPRYTNAKYIGAFHVNKVWRHKRTVAFSTDGKLFDHVGVIYAPDGLPTGDLPMEVEELSRAQYTHLYGSWYKFEIGN